MSALQLGQMCENLSKFLDFLHLNSHIINVFPAFSPAEQLSGVVVQQIKSFNRNYFQKMLNIFLIKFNFLTS